MPELIMFDLDQTLAESKQALDPEMAELVSRLLTKTRVAVISGGGLPQFLTQVIEKLPSDANFANLYLLPTSGGALYEWRAGNWQKIYEERLAHEEEMKIADAIRTASAETGLVDFNSPSFGERIEYRGSEVTFSALGQQAPLPLKQAWDPDKSKRRRLQKILAERLPEFSVGMGGATSIDITKRGVDKAYGIQKISGHLSIPIDHMLYVGDQLEPGGNDEAATRTAIKLKAVADPEDTKKFLKTIL